MLCVLILFVNGDFEKRILEKLFHNSFFFFWKAVAEEISRLLNMSVRGFEPQRHV